MHARLVISSEKSPGILARIVGVLRKVGLDVDNQEFSEDSDGRNISFDFFATKPELVKARNLLLALDGVVQVKAYSIKPKPESNNGGGATGSHNLAVRISAAYPDITYIIDEEISRMERDAAIDTLYSAGQQVAQLRARQFADSNSSDLIDLIEQFIVPEIDALADAEYAKEGFETGLKVSVSEFTKVKERSSDLDSMSSFSHEAVKCDFLRGYIEGAINLQDGFDNIKVQETRCRNEGHPYCLFEFE